MPYLMRSPRACGVLSDNPVIGLLNRIGIHTYTVLCCAVSASGTVLWRIDKAGNCIEPLGLMLYMAGGSSSVLTAH